MLGMDCNILHFYALNHKVKEVKDISDKSTEL